MNAAKLLVFLGNVKNKKRQKCKNDPPKSEIWRQRKPKMRFSRMILQVCWNFWIFFQENYQKILQIRVFRKKI